MPESTVCPGCSGSIDPAAKTCDGCHYFELVAGRVHFCGLPDCYCRALMREMPLSVLRTFIPAPTQPAEAAADA